MQASGDRTCVHVASDKRVNVSRDAQEHCSAFPKISADETVRCVRKLTCVYFESYHKARKKNTHTLNASVEAKHSRTDTAA